MRDRTNVVTAALLLTPVLLILVDVLALSWRSKTVDKGMLVALILVALLLVVGVLFVIRWTILSGDYRSELEGFRRNLDALDERITSLESRRRPFRSG